MDIVLESTLGVPSRMNIGQIYETVLGWAGIETGAASMQLRFLMVLQRKTRYNHELSEAGLPSLWKDVSL